MPGLATLALLLGLALPQPLPEQPGAGAIVMANGAALPTSRIEGTWHVTRVRENALPPAAKIEINFAEGRVWGIAGCSSFSATATTEGDALRLGMIDYGSTECETEVMEASSDFIRALGLSGRFEVTEAGVLTLYSGAVPLVVAER